MSYKNTPYDETREVEDMLYILLFIILVGCFLLGMTWLRVGLFNLSGSSMENQLRKVTGTPLMGLMAGIVMTAILQSSSAVTIITVGLVSARILTFPQTIGIILGTNIGTTVTLEFFTFDLSLVIIPLLVIGVGLQFFRGVKIKSSGFIFLGIGIIFSAINGFEWLSGPLAKIDSIQNLIYLMREHSALAFLTGTFLTALIQSSTVMTGIAMSFYRAGIFPLETGITIMIGANIGTCGTAFSQVWGPDSEARLTAYAHMWLNIGRSFMFLPFIRYFGRGQQLHSHTESGTQLSTRECDL